MGQSHKNHGFHNGKKKTDGSVTSTKPEQAIKMITAIQVGTSNSINVIWSMEFQWVVQITKTKENRKNISRI